MSNIVLDTKKVGDIEGKFYIPDYQRGYRWGKEEVKMLLTDLKKNGDNPYCLQPIVVKRVDDRYEVIDGQQRLTTIFLIYKYLEDQLKGIVRPNFEIDYQTRESSAEFLNSIDFDRKEENIDFLHIANAYECIKEFFGDNVKTSTLTDLNSYFDKKITIIWYEVDSNENGIELFERLNIGKILLTSSELVKALFLRDNQQSSLDSRQEEIALQWDEIEKSLHDQQFWAFLTNADGNEYPTRIDLILDLIARKKTSDREKYRTFFHFDHEIEERTQQGQTNVLLSVWEDIYLTFLTLHEWYLNHNFYHKIGYLISSKSLTLLDIYNIWKGENSNEPLNKKEFENRLDQEIIKSIQLKNIYDLESLSYSDNEQKGKIHKVLLLFNIETERIKDEGRRRFPFDKHKEGNWSLEHIHAQHPEGLSTNEKTLMWLKDHYRVLTQIEQHSDESLCSEVKAFIDEIETALNEKRDPKNVRNRFDELQPRIVKIFTEDSEHSEKEYKDSMSNMALIDGGQNAALSNYVFDAKRAIIIDYDKAGKYIPICTKMVFFKYYSPIDTSLHFWGERDRESYIEEISKVIEPYYTKSSDDNEE